MLLSPPEGRCRAGGVHVACRRHLATSSGPTSDPPPQNFPCPQVAVTPKASPLPPPSPSSPAHTPDENTGVMGAERTPAGASVSGPTLQTP